MTRFHAWEGIDIRWSGMPCGEFRRPFDRVGERLRCLLRQVVSGIHELDHVMPECRLLPAVIGVGTDEAGIAVPAPVRDDDAEADCVRCPFNSREDRISAAGGTSRGLLGAT